ncbi:MAG: type II secretion system protein [Myxococcota bacterium]|jgi:type IV pilus assembly protein PilA
MLNRYRRGEKGFTLIELMIVVAIIGILAAVAVPNFMKFQTKAKQTEAKTNLKAAYTAAKAKFAESQNYSLMVINNKKLIAGMRSIGYAPEANNLYTYYGNTEADLIPSQKPAAIAGLAVAYNGGAVSAAPCGAAVAYPWQVTTDANTGGFAVKAIANIDNDIMTDCWTIDSGNNLYNTCCGTAATIATVGTVGVVDGSQDDSNDVDYE